MADKRTTKRERKDEARKRRLEEVRRQQRRARLKKLYTGGIAVLVIVAIIVLILATRSGTSAHDKELAALAKDGGCSKIENPTKIPGKHIPSPQKGDYNTDPPSSGAHYAAPDPGPVNTGIYTQEIPNESYVHNLEHGHIAIFYKTDIDPAILEQLKTLVKSDPTYILIAPRSGLTTPLVFVAWGHVQRCPTPNAKTVDVAKAFVKEFKDKAPEHGLPGTPTGV